MTALARPHNAVRAPATDRAEAYDAQALKLERSKTKIAKPCRSCQGFRPAYEPALARSASLARQWSINPWVVRGIQNETSTQKLLISSAAIMSDLTLPVPPGSSNHGNPNLLCIPPRWFHYVLFYLSNYLAHAATVIKTPVQGRKEVDEGTEEENRIFESACGKTASPSEKSPKQMQASFNTEWNCLAGPGPSIMGRERRSQHIV
jgi:hypothetical protein